MAPAEPQHGGRRGHRAPHGPRRAPRRRNSGPSAAPDALALRAIRPGRRCSEMGGRPARSAAGATDTSQVEAERSRHGSRGRAVLELPKCSGRPRNGRRCGAARERRRPGSGRQHARGRRSAGRWSRRPPGDPNREHRGSRARRRSSSPGLRSRRGDRPSACRAAQDGVASSGWPRLALAGVADLVVAARDLAEDVTAASRRRRVEMRSSRRAHSTPGSRDACHARREPTLLDECRGNGGRCRPNRIDAATSGARSRKATARGSRVARAVRTRA